MYVLVNSTYCCCSVSVCLPVSVVACPFAVAVLRASLRLPVRVYSVYVQSPKLLVGSTFSVSVLRVSAAVCGGGTEMATLIIVTRVLPGYHVPGIRTAVATGSCIDLLRSFFWAGSVGTSLASRKFPPNTASFYYFLDLSSFSLLSTWYTFFVLPFSHFFRFFFSSFFVVPSFLYVRKANRQQHLIRIFSQVWLTLSPLTGRHPD